MDRISAWREAKCPVCGKGFFPIPDWVYRDHDHYFCSWSCMRKHEKQHGLHKKRPCYRARITPEQKEEVAERLRQGQRVCTIAQEMDVSISAVNRMKSEMKEEGLI